MKVGNVIIIGKPKGAIEFFKEKLNIEPVCQEKGCGQKLISCTLTNIGTCCPYCSSPHIHNWERRK